MNPEEKKLIARHESECTLDDICQAASKLLQFGGRLCMCQRPERLADVMESMRRFDIEPKRLRMVQQRKSKAPKLFLLEGRRGGKRGFLDVLPTLFIEDENGGFSQEMLEIYGDYYKVGYPLKKKEFDMAGILYVTGTPIGNLSDLSPRAAQTLSEVDFIAAEDTRVTLKLLNHLGIKKPMVSYYEHNKRERGEIICARIEQGENCAIVTDAGMPCISDPGEDLMKLCAERGVKTVVIPGPSAVVSALAVSGLETGQLHL